MYVLEAITQFEAQQLIDCLGAQNQGKGSIQDIRKIIKLLDRFDSLAGHPPNKAVSNLMNVVDTLPEEKRTKVTIEEAQALQAGIWDEIYIPSLTLENEEFLSLKAAIEHVSESNQIPRDARSLKRFDRLFKRFESAEAVNPETLTAGKPKSNKA